mmetsp:Transcript_27190/g.54933  ORF Transcript_27190/g.54933 Transcript_27190/m.54933 type:complete len:221 (-) Transcript_27190:867-1529(-)
MAKKSSRTEIAATAATVRRGKRSVVLARHHRPLCLVAVVDDDGLSALELRPDYAHAGKDRPAKACAADGRVAVNERADVQFPAAPLAGWSRTNCLAVSIPNHEEPRRKGYQGRPINGPVCEAHRSFRVATQRVPRCYARLKSSKPAGPRSMDFICQDQVARGVLVAQARVAESQHGKRGHRLGLEDAASVTHQDKAGHVAHVDSAVVALPPVDVCKRKGA